MKYLGYVKASLICLLWVFAAEGRYGEHAPPCPWTRPPCTPPPMKGGIKGFWFDIVYGRRAIYQGIKAIGLLACP